MEKLGQKIEKLNLKKVEEHLVGEFGLSELEKEQLMSNLGDTIKDIQDESDRINEEIETKQTSFPES